MIRLRQSTASQEVPLGPFLDSVDGNTQETGLTIVNTDIKIWKNGATSLVNKNSGGATHMANGVYYAVLDATDSDTVGPLVIFCHPTGALAVRVECEVLPASVYDAHFTTPNTYQAKASMVDDNTNATDRYSVVWFKNGEPITTGITSPTIQVFKWSDGTDLIAAATAMTQIGSSGTYRYNATGASRIANGDGYTAIMTATIDGSSRVWYQPIVRDS